MEENKELLQVKEALKDLGTDLKKQIDEKTKSIEQKASSEEVKSLEEKIKTLESVRDELKEDLKSIQIKMNEKVAEGGKENLKSVLTKSFESNKDQIEKAVQGGVTDKFKAASIITTGNFGTGVILGQREAGINDAPYRQRFITDLIVTQNGGVGSDPLTWIEKRPKEGSPATVSESNTKPLLDWTYVQGKTTAETIAVVVEMTKQAARNMQAIGDSYQNEVIPQLMDELDYQILLGDGGPNTQGIGNNLKGIVEYAQDFTGASLAEAVKDANYFDVLRAAILQVRKGNKAASGYQRKTGYIPSAILVSPDTMAKFDLTKNDYGIYVLPPFTASDGTRIKGIPVIENDFVGDDQFIVGDFSKVLLNIVEGLTTQIGWINDQFIKNQFSFLAEIVASLRIKYHDQWAFVKGDFTTALPMIQTT